MQLGAGSVSKLYLGSTEAQKAYLGSMLVLDNTAASNGLLSKVQSAYLLQEASGAFVDSLAVGSDLTIATAPTYQQAGNVETYAILGGQSNLISYTFPSGGFTVSMRTYSANNYRGLFALETGDLKCVSLTPFGGNNVRFSDGFNENTIRVYGTTLSVPLFVALVVTPNGTGSYKARLYYNGTLSSEVTVADDISVFSKLSVHRGTWNGDSMTSEQLLVWNEPLAEADLDTMYDNALTFADLD